MRFPLSFPAFQSLHISLFGAFAYTDGEYVKFTNAPLPLEETGPRVDCVQVAFKDISGGDLPGISKYAFSLGGELSSNPVKFIGQEGKFSLAFETSYRSSFSSSSSPSQYLNVDSYGLLNAKLGTRHHKGCRFSCGDATSRIRITLSFCYRVQAMPVSMQPFSVTP